VILTLILKFLGLSALSSPPPELGLPMRRQALRLLRGMDLLGTAPKDPILIVLGATGTGKSQVCCNPPPSKFQAHTTALQLAVDLAKQFNGEIINGDAVQMYDGLPIVTNKISVEEQEGIPHHLLGFVALDEEPWRVGLFRKKASQIITEIRSRGRLPILVGGTHYYTQSLLFGDSMVRDRADDDSIAQSELSHQEISEKYPILDGPTEDIIAKLREVDPTMADRWHPNDRRKIRRSLEIFLMTGKKASEIYSEQKDRKISDWSEATNQTGSAMDKYSPLLFWVHAESETLKKRLDGRVENMVKAGLLEEVKAMNSFLLQQEIQGTPVDRTRGIWVSIGFKEFEQYLKALESGTGSPEELSRLLESSIEQTQAATRQYAKRQVRWIRLKLVPALKDDNALDKLYLLDGTDVSKWKGTVAKPAIDIVTSFLQGRELEPPLDICQAASEILTAAETGIDKKPDVWFRQVCDLCNITAVTDTQWQIHLKSRRHRALTKKKQRNGVEGKFCHQSGDSNSPLHEPRNRDSSDSA
jgi:tRNA dimethylallyltransferase